MAGLKEATRRRGQLRIDQQRALRAELARGKAPAKPKKVKAKKLKSKKKKGQKGLDVRGISKLVKDRHERFESVFE